MSMQAESLEVLEKADVAPAQARAIVRAIEIELGSAKETLATKQDLKSLAQELRQEMARLRVEIHSSASSIVRQMYGALLGQMAVLLGFAYVFATYVR
jgi:FtsZ-binding cell division protein ZapB